MDDLLDGLDALRASEARWLQVDVSAPQLSASALAAAVDRFGRSGVGGPTGRWWFVRKAPGVRIRLETAGPGARDGVLAPFATLGPAQLSVYESERFRFGGDAGMEVAHDLFTFDTTLAVLRERLDVPPLRWSAWVLGDLARRLTDDVAETWDAWKRLDEVLAPFCSRPDTAAADLTPSAGGVPPGPGDSLARGHGMVEHALRAATLHRIGRRSWFGAAAVFHWNRLGFEPQQMQAVTTAALRQIDAR